MATKSMAYDHPAYTAPFSVGGVNAAGASAKSCRFTPFTTMLVKSMQATVVTAGTGTGNATINLVKIASGGTAITTYGTVVVFGTQAAGVTTNLAVNGTLNAGDDVYVQHGADAASVFTLGLELYLSPGANVTV